MAYCVERNQPFIDSLEQFVLTWWEKWVLPGVEPPADDAPAACAVLKKLHPLDNGEAVALPSGELVNRLERARAWRRRADTLENTTKIQLMSALGDATYAVTPDGRCVSWKTQTRHVAAKGAYTQTSRVLRTHKRAPKGVDHVHG